MGVDLSLLPLECDNEGVHGKPAFQFSHSMLSVWRRRELWPLIEKMERDTPSADFTSFRGPGLDGESGYGKTTETPYGERLKWAAAGDLAKLAPNNAVTDNPQNRAVWAYLSELPPDTKVALYWH